jgi:formylglycine-generating enzyme required for sulfatase activity
MADTVALVGALKFCNSITVTWTDTPGPNENRPIDCVSWWEAMAFCTWAGGYLPTEAEWNYAATGGDQQRAYPWSTPAGNLTLDSSFASYQDASGNCDGDGSPSCSLADILEVGSKPKGDGRWGQSDLAGNLSEWVLDWSAAYASPCTDCANLSVATERVTRGGNWLSPMRFMRTGVSFTTVPANRAQYYGFRCARKP